MHVDGSLMAGNANCWKCNAAIPLYQMPYCKDCKSKQKSGTLEKWL